jgi:hypothetical protein
MESRVYGIQRLLSTLPTDRQKLTVEYGVPWFQLKHVTGNSSVKVILTCVWTCRCDVTDGTTALMVLMNGIVVSETGGR